MERKGWYLVAYDICSPGRLARVHYHLKKKGIAAQKSVFFVRDNESGINALLDEIAERMKLSEDDLRAYPIRHPSDVWVSGPNPLADFPILDFDQPKPKQTEEKRKNTFGWKQVFNFFTRRKMHG